MQRKCQKKKEGRHQLLLRRCKIAVLGGRKSIRRMMAKDSTRKKEPRYGEKRLQGDLGKGKYSIVTEEWQFWKGVVQDKAGNLGQLYQTEYQTELFIRDSTGRSIRSGFEEDILHSVELNLLGTIQRSSSSRQQSLHTLHMSENISNTQTIKKPPFYHT